MRLKLKFYCKSPELPYNFNKYDIQGMIYSCLFDGGLDIHQSNNFRFFTFSDIFPDNNLEKDKLYNIIISSADDNIISTLYDILSKNNFFYLYKNRFEIVDLKKFDLKLSKKFITGSPIVIYFDNKKNDYFSLKTENSISFFIRRIKENALKRYNVFTGENITFYHPLFDRYKFHKEVSVVLYKMGVKFNVIGTMWYSLELNKINYNELKFYKFLMDTGIGEKSSLGFGFINPVR